MSGRACFFAEKGLCYTFTSDNTFHSWHPGFWRAQHSRLCIKYLASSVQQKLKKWLIFRPFVTLFDHILHNIVNCNTRASMLPKLNDIRVTSLQKKWIDAIFRYKILLALTTAVTQQKIWSSICASWKNRNVEYKTLSSCYPSGLSTADPGTLPLLQRNL